MKNPKVSIIIPVYNGSNYLRQAIESALNQTYKNTEIIVINDGSNDGGASERIAKSFGHKIRYYKKKNGGVASALNFGISKATGEYFSWLSHDDVYLSGKIQAQVAFIVKQPKNTICYSDFELINSQGRRKVARRIKKIYQEKFLQSLIKIRFMHGCTLLIPKEAFKKAGHFNTKYRNAQDYDLWFRLVKAGYKFRHLDKITLQSRIHRQQGTAQRVSRQIKEEDELYIKVMKTFSSKEIFQSDENKAKNYFGLALSLKKNGASEAANFAFILGNKYVKNTTDRLFYWYCRLFPNLFKYL